MTSDMDDRVSRRRYQREQQARAEAESLLEAKSRELFLANQQLSEHSKTLEQAVIERTTELRLALEEAEAAMAVKSRFVATMSHEIRTPLGGMLGMIDLLEMDETDPTKREYLTNAKTAGLALKRIVNDVLDFSKMEAGVFIFDNEAVDVRALVDSIVALTRPNLTGVDRVISSHIDDNFPQFFLGDATRIRQVISNLVSNAVRYSHDGPIKVYAKASPHPKGALVRIEVEDRGVGIDRAEFENLFKDFSQISNSLTSAAQGSGLGLAISKRIVEGCGGNIGVESTLGHGSTFWFELPVKCIGVEAPQDVSRDLSPKTSHPTGLTGAKILLAEDNVINQKLLVTYLTRMGVDVDLAENGQIAVDLFEPKTYDLILMDVAMPEMDGLEATRVLRANWAPENLPPIVMLTAHVMDAIKDDAAKVGVGLVLSKPIPYDELREALETVIINAPISNDANVDRLSAQEKQLAQPTYVSFMDVETARELAEIFPPRELTNLVQKYVDEGRVFLDEILRSHEASEFKTTAAQAHSLRGASLLLGFKDVEILLIEVEQNAHSLDIADLISTTNRITAILDQIQAAI